MKPSVPPPPQRAKPTSPPVYRPFATNPPAAPVVTPAVKPQAATVQTWQSAFPTTKNSATVVQRSLPIAAAVEIRPGPPVFSAQAVTSFANPTKFPAGSRCVQPLYGQNTPAKFETEKGSIYTVTTDDVLRDKFDKTKHGGNNKNIFYADEHTAKTIRKDLKKKNGATNVRVVGLTLTYEINNSKKNFDLYDTPKVGLRPLDMVLDHNGNYVDSIHKGHTIKKILG